MASLIQDGDKVLFQGDSITDCGRNRNDISSLGNGYPSIVAALLSALYPEKRVSFINKAISGNRSRDLEERWEEDCLQLNPNWVSILIGVNDTWRRYDDKNPTSVESFEASYRNILTQIKERLDAKIIILEPFVLPYPEDRKEWREDLDPKIHVVRKLAAEFADIFIPLDGIFSQASVYQSPERWTRDGVHPITGGHGLIAKAWLEAVHAM